MVNGIREFDDQGFLDITGISFIPLGRFVHHMNLHGLLYDPNSIDGSLSSSHVFMIMNDYLTGRRSIDPNLVIVCMNNVCEVVIADMPNIGKLFVNGRFFGLIGQGVPPLQELHTCGKLGRRSGFSVNPKVGNDDQFNGGGREIEHKSFPDPFTMETHSR
jgi:hypothetical protein